MRGSNLRGTANPSEENGGPGRRVGSWGTRDRYRSKHRELGLVLHKTIGLDSTLITFSIPIASVTITISCMAGSDTKEVS